MNQLTLIIPEGAAVVAIVLMPPVKTRAREAETIDTDGEAVEETEAA